MFICRVDQLVSLACDIVGHCVKHNSVIDTEIGICILEFVLVRIVIGIADVYLYAVLTEIFVNTETLVVCDVAAESKKCTVFFDRSVITFEQRLNVLERSSLVVAELKQNASDLRVAFCGMIYDVACRRKRARISRLVNVIADLSIHKLGVMRLNFFVGYLRERISEHLFVFLENSRLVIAVEIIVVIFICAFKILVELVECGLHILLSILIFFGRYLVVHIIGKLVRQFACIGKTFIDIFVRRTVVFSDGSCFEKILILFGFFGLFFVRTCVLRLFFFEIAYDLLPAVFKSLVCKFNAISAFVNSKEILVGKLCYFSIVRITEIVLCDIIFCIKQLQLLF